MSGRAGIVLGFGLGALSATIGGRVSEWVIGMALGAQKARRPLL